MADNFGGRLRSLTDPTVVGPDADPGATFTFAENITKHGPWWVTTRATGLLTPYGVVVDPTTGDAYVCENTGHRITKVTPDGVKTTFAGSGVAGFKDALGTAAQFNSPRGICRDTSGNFYVPDFNHRVRKIDPSGNVTTVAGSGTAGYLDGPAASAQFNAPNGITVDSTGNLYVVEKDGNRVRKVDTTGNVTLVAGSTAGTAGTVNGVGGAARFSAPANCQITPDDKTLYVADQASNAVRAIDLATNTVTTYATMTGPIGVEVNPNTGLVYSACYDAVRVYESPTAGTAVSIVGGGATADNTYGNTVGLSRPLDIARAPDGTLVMTDYGDGRLRLFTQVPQLLDSDTGQALSDTEKVTKHGPWWVTTRATGLNQPFDVVIDPATGDAYVTEAAGQKITKVTPAGVKTTFAGTGVAGFTNGSAATAQFSGPRGICRDPAGNFYVADMTNHRVRKIDNAGNVTTFAGTGTAGYLDGPALSAQFNAPVGVAVDSAGNVYVVDRDGHKVRKIDTAGNVTLVAGAATAGTAGSVNGVGSAARFNNPHLCRLTPDGSTLYVAEQVGSAVRKIDLATNTVTTYATMAGPAGVYVNPDTGWVYIGAFDAVRIYESPSQGAAVSIAGGGATADNTYGHTVQLSHPIGIDRTPDGKLLVADNGDGRVRLLSLATQLADGDTGASLTDAQTDPYITWPDTGKFTESAQITFQTITPPTDSGKGTEAASLSFKTIVGSDTGNGTEGARFDDPAQGPPYAQPTGRSEQGTFTSSAIVPPSITVNPGELVIVAFASSGGSSPYGAASVTSGLGLTWNTVVYPSGNYWTGSAFWAVNTGTSPVTGTLSCGNLLHPNHVWSATYYTGFNPLQPIRNATAAYAASTTLGAPAAPNSRSFGIFTGTGTTNPTPRTGWQQVAVADGNNLYCAVHLPSAKYYDTTVSASNPNPNLIIAFEMLGPPYPVTDTDSLGTGIDDQTDPGHVEYEFGTFTDDAYVAISRADTGKVTETGTLSGYVFKSGSDTGTVVEDVLFSDPELGPAAVKFVGDAGGGVVTSAASVDLGTIIANPGDLVLVAFYSFNGGSNVTAPTGLTGLGLTWTRAFDGGTGFDRLGLWWAHVGTSDPVTGVLTATGAGGGPLYWTAGRYRDHYSKTPIRATYYSASPITLSAPAYINSRSFLLFGTDSTTPPTPKAGWQQLTLGKGTLGEVGLHWRPDKFDTTANVALTGASSRLTVAFEIQPAPFPVTDGDTGTVTDDQADPVPVALDYGTFSDDAYVVISRADTGAFGESALVATSKTSTEIGAVDEAAILRMLGMADGDLAKIVEGTDTFVVATGADIGRVVDTATVYIVPVVVSDTDTATFADAVVSLGPPPVLLTGTDTVKLVGETAELAELLHVATGADTGRLTDTASIDGADQYPNSSDTATGLDKQTVKVTVVEADTATVTEDQGDPVLVTNQYFSSTETGIVTDRASRVGTAASDTASATEAASVVVFASKTGGDSAAATDQAVSVRITTADSGLGSDTVSDFFESARTATDNDSGRWRDGLSLLIRNDPLNNLFLDVNEQGTVTEGATLLATVTAADDARFAEAGTAILTNRVLTDDDTGVLTEDQVAAETRESWDTGLIDEAVIVRLTTSGTNDFGVVQDRASVLVLVAASADSGGFADRGSVRATIGVDDTGSVADDVSYLGVPVIEPGDLDTGHVTESASRVEFSRILAASDAGQLSETTALSIASNFIDVVDTGTAADAAQTLSVAVTGAETGTVGEIQSVFDGFNLNTADADTAAGVEPTPVIGVRGPADQLAAGTETASVYSVQLVNGVWDRANAAEPTPTITVYTGDTGTAADTADLFETLRLPTDGDQGRLRDRLDVLLVLTQDAGMNAITVDDEGSLTDTAHLGGATGDGIDNAGLSDGEELLAAAADTDTAAATAETETLFAAPVGVDTGVFVIEDSHVVELTPPTVPQVEGDTATLTEQPRPVIAMTVDETVTSADADGLVGPADTDSAAVTDTLLAVGLVGDDTAALTDADTVTIALAGDDTATFDEPAQIATQSDDTAAATDTEALFAAAMGVDITTGDDQAQVVATLSDGDTTATTDDQALFADTRDDDTAGITDTQDVRGSVHDDDTATHSDGQDLLAAPQGADTGGWTESAVVMVDLGGQTGLITAETGLFVEDQTTTGEQTGADTGAGIDAQALFADVTDAETAAMAEDQTLTGDITANDAAHITEAAFLVTDSGMGSFTGDTGTFTETETVGRWAASVEVTDTDTGLFTETQSAHRSIDLTDFLDEKPGSLLKVNVVTRQVDMSSYFDDDEYPINHALPLQARNKLDAFASNTAPPARFGDMLEDADFRYRYLSRWVTPSRRETGWFLVEWRRSPVGPIEWLS